jgi:hypothetical protein
LDGLALFAREGTLVFVIAQFITDLVHYRWRDVLGMFIVALLPSIWGIVHAAKNWFSGHRNVIVLALFLNALSIAALPFSTFRETGGLIRFACGLVLAVLLYGGRFKLRRVLNYSPLWLVLNVFLFK